MTTATLEAPIRIFRATPLPQAGPPQPSRLLCSSCRLRELCLPRGMTGDEVERLDGMLLQRRRVAAGQPLYRQGAAFNFLFAVRSGMFKTCFATAEGREQVGGFHMAGELMGLDGLAEGRYASTATALDDAEVCLIAYAHLCDPMVGGAAMQQQVSRMMSREIVREQGLALLLGSLRAEERLASFLLNLSRRMQARGYSASEFHLRMTRAEIGSYLGLTLETVSRMFSEFQRQGLIEVDKRHVRIVDLEGLRLACERRAH